MKLETLRDLQHFIDLLTAQGYSGDTPILVNIGGGDVRAHTYADEVLYDADARDSGVAGAVYQTPEALAKLYGTAPLPPWDVAPDNAVKALFFH